MLYEIVMPKSGMSMESGTIIRWMKAPGDAVSTGDAILEIETDKVSMEVESEADGVLLKITHEAGEEVPVAEIIGYIGDTTEEPIPTEKLSPVTESASPRRPAMASPPAVHQHGIPGSGKVRATPAARRVAKEHDLNLSDFASPGKTFYLRDVQHIHTDILHTQAGSAITDAGFSDREKQPLAHVAVPFLGSQKTLAQKMSESHAAVPPVTLYARARIDQLMAWKKRCHEQKGDSPSLTALFLRVFSHVLAQHPAMRRQLHDDQIIILPDVHISIAVATSQGLFAPVIHHADTVDVFTLSSRLRTLVEKTHQKKLTADDMKGGVCTFSNLGMYGVSFFTPMVTLPQSGTLGVGSAEPAPFFTSQGTEFFPSVWYCCTVDHRIINGDEAALFLKDMVSTTEYPLDMVVY